MTGARPGQALWMQLGQMRALGNPSTSNSISMLSSYFPGWKKISTRKGQPPIVESPSQTTPTDSHKPLQLWRSCQPKNWGIGSPLFFPPGSFTSCQPSAVLRFLPGPREPAIIGMEGREERALAPRDRERRWNQDTEVLCFISELICVTIPCCSADVLWDFLEIYLAVPLATRPLWSQRHLVQGFLCPTVDQIGRTWQLSRRQILRETAQPWLLFTGDWDRYYQGYGGPHFLSREVLFLSSCLFHTRTQLGEMASTEEAD